MSLSQDRPSNPAKLYLKVKSGQIIYWDKEAQENVVVPEPFSFIVLDTLATVKGWSDSDDSGFWSNEVRFVGKDELNVRTAKGTKARGIWKDIKSDPALSGAKYNSSVYIAYKGKDGLEIANLALTGAALNAWIEFTNKHKTSTNKVVLSEWADAKKGSVKYKTPVFTAEPMKDEEKAEAVELDKQLQGYFAEYFSYAPEDGHNEESEKTRSKDVVLDDIDDKPIDLSEIPF